MVCEEAGVVEGVAVGPAREFCDWGCDCECAWEGKAVIGGESPREVITETAWSVLPVLKCGKWPRFKSPEKLKGLSVFCLFMNSIVRGIFTWILESMLAVEAESVRGREEEELPRPSRYGNGLISGLRPFVNK